MYKALFKPFIEFTLALIVLFILFPVVLLVGILLSFSNNGSIFFTQLRPGKNNRIFRLVKFRSMNNKRDRYGQLLPDAQRLTSIGRFIRATSLDELPQLFNVVMGDMSLIGPRPLLIKYLDRYTPEQARRHEVRPGITGWAQVNGRNAISWEERFKLDVWYVDNMSFTLDMKILLLTLVKVLKREGISSTTSVSMETFMGSQKERED